MFFKRTELRSESADGGGEPSKGGNTIALGVIGLVIAGAIGYQLFSSSAEEAPSAAGEASNGPIELAMWDQEEAANTPFLDKWIDEFEQENPNIKITRQTFQVEDLRNRYTTFATGGQAAEILYGPNDFAGVFATAGLIDPIDDYVDQGRFTKPALDAVQLGGKHMAVPLSYGNHLMLFYNKSMISEAPKTTEELVAVAKEHSEPEKNVYGLAFFQNEPFWFAPIMGGFGAWPLKKSPSGDVQIDLNSEGVVKALQFLKGLKFDEKVIPDECDYDCAKGLFIEEKSPLTISGDWTVAEYGEALGKDKLGIAPLPQVSATGQHMSPMLSGRYMFLLAGMPENKKQAVAKFVKFMTSERVQIEVGELMNRIPATTAALESEAIRSLADLQPVIAAAEHGRAMPAEAEMRAAWDAMRPALQKVMSGDLEPENAARLMQQSALEKLAALKE